MPTASDRSAITVVVTEKVDDLPVNWLVYLPGGSLKVDYE
jgi:hypothetical protein